MKKTYQKPMIVIEDFTVSEVIAAGCGMVATLKGDECYLGGTSLEGSGLFLASENCEVPFDKLEAGWDGICYHTQQTIAYLS